MNGLRINLETEQKTFGTFDLWPINNDLDALKVFVRGTQQSEIIILAIYDDAYVHMDQKIKDLIALLGSSAIHTLSFRDSWVFIGQKQGAGIVNVQEKLIKSNAENKYGGWPEQAEINGCIRL